ncbi:MAG: GNAT family N-acetyltransferase [Candidatus Brocadiia bacterium]
MQKLLFRPFTPQDYDEVTALWSTAGIKLTLSDSRPEIEKMLARNPGTCFVALSDGSIIGAVMGSWDGRRGFVHHLAIRPEVQGTGAGKAMMKELERRFESMGVVKITFLVESDNEKVLGFYEKLGYSVRGDLIAVSKTLRER